MQDIDLSGVDPTRWAETRRRVGIIREWCAKRRHTKAEGIAAATRLGLSVGQFNRLVASWKAHGDALRISGSNRRRGASTGTTALPAATRAAIDAAIATVGADAAFQAVRDEAARRCRDAGTPEASEGMVHYLLMRARRDGAHRARADSARLLIGHVQALLPVSDGEGGAGIPTLLLAVEEASRRVIAHRLTIHGAPSANAVDSLVNEVREGQPTDRRGEIVVAKDLATSPQEGIKHGGGPRLLASILGSHLDTLPLRHQRARPGETRRAPGQPVSPEDAHTAVSSAVDAHNRRL